MNKVFDGSFEYEMPYKSIQPRCDLRIWQEPMHISVVLMSEPTDGYNGVSVTNAIEKIAGAVQDRFSVGITRTLWIEHYPIRSLGKIRNLPDETFDLVTFDWTIVAKGNGTFRAKANGPAWQRVNREWMEALVGESV